MTDPVTQGINITANILRQLDSAVLDDYFYRQGASTDSFISIYGTQPPPLWQVTATDTPI